MLKRTSTERQQRQDNASRSFTLGASDSAISEPARNTAKHCCTATGSSEIIPPASNSVAVCCYTVYSTTAITVCCWTATTSWAPTWIQEQDNSCSPQIKQSTSCCCFYNNTIWTCEQGDSQKVSLKVGWLNEGTADRVTSATRRGI